MADYTAKKISDMQAGFGGGFIKARAELGVSSFGMQVIAMPPNFTDYPEHDHGEDGQEEVYAVLEGSGTMEVAGDNIPMDSETLIRVPAGTMRKVVAGPDGIQMLVLGGTPGQLYEIPEMTELETAG